MIPIDTRGYRWYHYFLWSFIAYLFITSSVALDQSFRIASLVHIFLTLVVVWMIISASTRVGIAIKVLAGAIALGSILRFISYILFLIVGDVDQIEMRVALFSGLHLFCAAVLFLYADDMVVFRKVAEESEEQIQAP